MQHTKNSEKYNPQPAVADVHEAARYIGAALRRARILFQSRELPCFRMGKHDVVRYVDLDAYLARRAKEDGEAAA